MRIGILSPAPWTVGSYGVLAAGLLRTLRALGHETACFAFDGLNGAPLSWDDGIPVYPALFHEMGQDMGMHARHFQADLVIPVMDLWHFELRAWEGVKLCPWFPIDHAPLSPYIQAIAERVFLPIVYSKFGLAQCVDAGIHAAYVPCSVDTTVFSPIDRAEARAQLGWPQDRYIVGMVQANAGRPSRKAFEQQFRAFKHFQRAHPDALLYVHTFVNAGREIDGENILGMCRSVGLEVGKDVLFPDQYEYHTGIPPAQLALCYNGMDVLLQATTGEGFGLPLIEAQASGTPVICGDWTSMSELCFAGWLVPRPPTVRYYDQEIEDDALWGTLEGYKVFPRVSAIVDALERAYLARDDEAMRRLARLGSYTYDTNVVSYDYWTPLLAELEVQLDQRSNNLD